MFTEMELFESPDLITLDFCLCGWKNSEAYKIKVDTPDEFLALTLDAAACIKRREDQMRRPTRDLRTRVAKCTEVGGEIFLTPIVNCKKKLSFLCKEIYHLNIKLKLN